MQSQEVDTMSSPLGETLRRARLSKNVTFEDAERVTRIRREYLEALEQEDFNKLPAPVYARGFLRSYAGYLGLDPGELMPFFPVGHVEEPQLDPLPEMAEPRTWNMSGVLAVGVVGFLILLVIALYSVGREGTSPALAPQENVAGEGGTAPLVVPQAEDDTTVTGPAGALPDLIGQSLEDAIAIVESTGATYVVVGVSEGDAPVGQIVDHEPGPDETVGTDDLVTLFVSQ
jgi:cytoskeletal protein RodZ